MIAGRWGAFVTPVRPSWQWLVAAAAASAMLLIGVGNVAAHADLISADPAPGSTVSGSPSTIRLSFSQPLRSTSRVDLFTGQFQGVPGVTTSVAGSEMHAGLAQALAPATYTVEWTAVSDDGHSTQGSYQFAVAHGTGPLAGRLALFVAAGATVLCGGVLLFVWVLNWRKQL